MIANGDVCRMLDYTEAGAVFEMPRESEGPMQLKPPPSVPWLSFEVAGVYAMASVCQILRPRNVLGCATWPDKGMEAGTPPPPSFPRLSFAYPHAGGYCCRYAAVDTSVAHATKDEPPV